LGARVRVHWPAEHQWFEGVVQRINVQDGRSIFNVAYDDGDDQWHAASQEWSLVTPAVPAARAVRHDEHGRPILRGHPPPRQRELMLQWLHANGHLRAPEWDGDPTAIPRPLKNLWERTSAARQSDQRRTSDNRSGRHRDDRERGGVRRARLRAHPRARNKARNGEAGVRAMLAYEPAAHAAAAYVDVGRLGDRVCTHCAALLWAGEAVRVPPGKDREGGTGWRGTLCCSNGAVLLPPISRSPAIDALFDDDRNAKDLEKHARR
jgi:hypothetical protein